MAQPLFDIQQVGCGDLGSLVEPIPSGTVSRTLVATPAFRQVLFSMDASQEISEHRTPLLAIVQVISGRLKMTVAGATHTLEAGGWLSMPPDVPHALKAESGVRFLLTMVRPGGN